MGAGAPLRLSVHIRYSTASTVTSNNSMSSVVCVRGVKMLERYSSSTKTIAGLGRPTNFQGVLISAAPFDRYSVLPTTFN
jgi:hypothetical protein